MVVYDIETKQPVLSLRDRHQHHVNAVCYGDTSSPHLLYSGSDDATLRVWDRRSMADGREAGAFMGHTEGLTYVDSKGDGRYVISNGKDQTMKLWDLRKMMTTADFDRIDPTRYTTGFDYRFEPYPDDYYEPHEHDCSVVTFRGHRVLKTLIRCHFSPPGSSNSRYVYTGSEDGKVYVYNMDATLAGTIDVGAATMNSRPREPDVFASAYEMSGEMLWRTCVRDASWHPNAPVLAGKLRTPVTYQATFANSEQQPRGMDGDYQVVPARSIVGITVPMMTRVTRQSGRATTRSYDMCPNSITTVSMRPHHVRGDVRCVADQCDEDSSMRMKLGERSGKFWLYFSGGPFTRKISTWHGISGHLHLKVRVEIVFMQLIGLMSNEDANTIMLFLKSKIVCFQKASGEIAEVARD